MVRPVLTRLKAADDRETQGWRLVPVTRPYLVETLTCAARFLKYDGRSKGWVRGRRAGPSVADVPGAAGSWKLPILSGIIHTPFLRTRRLDVRAARLRSGERAAVQAGRESFPPIPREPSRDDALAALATLEQLIATFPFVAAADRPVALSAILTSARSPRHGDGTAARLHVTDSRDRQVAAGRHRRHARDRPTHAGHIAGQDRGRTREATRRRAARRRRCDLARQLRASPRKQRSSARP